jgi:hypothetical protein
MNPPAIGTVTDKLPNAITARVQQRARVGDAEAIQNDRTARTRKTPSAIGSVSSGDWARQ